MMMLSEVGQGNKQSLEDLWREGMNEITENVMDKRTEKGAKRKITIEMEFFIGGDGDDRNPVDIKYGLKVGKAAITGGVETIDIVEGRTLADAEAYLPGQVDYRDAMNKVDQDGVILN